MEQKQNTSKNRDYPSDYSLLSITDSKSRITYANRSFCEVSGFSRQELESQPHNIVRHPDMPKAAFKNLWQYLESGQSWMGLVKNKCKDDQFHYWVNAYVTPIQDDDGNTVEYQSVRTKPNERATHRAEALYQKINQGANIAKLIRPNLPMHQRIIAAVGLFFLLSLGLNFSPLNSFWFGLIETSAVLGLAYFIRQQLRPIQRLSKLAREVYDNPLMQKIYTGNVSDTAAIELAMIAREGELKAVLGRVRDSSLDVEDSINECLGSIGILTEQRKHTDRLACAIETMAKTIDDIADTTAQAATLSDKALLAVNNSTETVERSRQMNATLSNELRHTQQDIDALNKCTQEIEGMVNIIRDISDQTNLLALNAAIEAARAGEQGRGFAVVAEEVRALAERTQSTTVEIDGMIHNLRESAEKTVNAIHEGAEKSQQSVQEAQNTTETLKNIGQMMHELSNSNTHIAEETQELNETSDELHDNANDISDMAEKSIESVNLIAKTDRALRNQKGLIDQFIRKFP